MDGVSEFLDAFGITEGVARSQIETLLADLRESNAQSVILRVERGGKLRQLYALISHGAKEDWLEAITPLAGYGSSRTARRDMALWDRLGGRLDELKALVSEGSLSALQAHAVRSPAVAQMLSDWHDEQPGLFDIAVTTGAIYSPLTGESIALDKASDTDAVAIANEEESERIKRGWAHKDGTPASRFMGTIADIIAALLRLDSKQVYIAFVKPVVTKEGVPSHDPS